jgi:hypothetical protein
VPESAANGFDHDDPAFVVPSPMGDRPESDAAQADEQRGDREQSGTASRAARWGRR